MQESFVTSVGFVKVCLADNFKRCVHVLYGNTAVNDIHAIIAHDISNGSAAAYIKVLEGGWKSLSAKETGRIGGIMARKKPKK